MQARGLPILATVVPVYRNLARILRACLAVIPRSAATRDDGTPFSRCLTRYFRDPPASLPVMAFRDRYSLK